MYASAQLLLAELVLDVQQGAEILADALALLDADAVFRLFNLTRVRTIDHDAQHQPNRLAPELEIEQLQPVAARHAFRGLPQAADGVWCWRSDCP